MAPTVERVKKDGAKHTGLKKCFSALVDRKQINLDADVLQLILKKELQINVDTLDEPLTSVLPFMLVVYMKSWPGWQRSKEYYSGKLNFKEWYEKFRQYIVLRLNFLIKNGYKNAIEEIKCDKTNEVTLLNPGKTYLEHGTQTDFLAPKGFAPFNICIKCPPSVMNSLVFTDFADDIIMRQHPDILWTKIDIKCLINWPNIEVEFSSPELSFRRNSCCEYTRYINFVNTPLTYEKVDFIEQVKIIEPGNGRNCFTLNMLTCYVDEYIAILKSVTDLEKEFISKLEIILKEFLMDIEEIDMNKTMATNTSVLFNIGKTAFHRNKKITKGTLKSGYHTEIGYCEVIVPKMETSLNFFKGVQDLNTPNVSFSYLNIIKSLLVTNPNKAAIGAAIPTLKYKCNFCKVNFSTDLEVLKHLEELHKMDPCVICIRCKKSYTMCYLTKERWFHRCSTSVPNRQAPIKIK